MAGLRTRLAVLFETSRPDQLLLILGVYFFGTKVALAGGATLSIPAVAAGVAVLIPLSASIHYANEYADYETDALTNRTPFSGGSGALQRTGLPRTVPLAAAVATLAIGSVLTVVFAVGGLLALPAVAILSVSVVLGWQYSVGPLKLAWRGLGELTNAALGGLALPVYAAAVLDGSIGFVALAAVPFFLLVLLNLFATQWPDREADRQAGKRTLAVRWSPRRLRYSYVVVALLAAVSLAALADFLLPPAVVIASLPVVPLVGWGAYGYTERRVPWPTVSAMVGLLALQTAGWCWLLYA
ncbi:prenyltransferase [Halovenus halobia]|uniref:prenyltransferase n=1 Tax=Halovenus halobia TaxID=3396622 RepID=UPI003F54C568